MIIEQVNQNVISVTHLQFIGEYSGQFYLCGSFLGVWHMHVPACVCACVHACLHTCIHVTSCPLWGPTRRSRDGVFLSSVPSFKTEWYWHRLMKGDPPFVEFHNRVYGCSGVKPDRFPCTGPNFTWVELYMMVLFVVAVDCF